MTGEQDQVRRVYCVIPRDLAHRLLEPLRRHFRDERLVEVVVERRADDRRVPEDRRAAAAEEPARPPAAERRRIRNLSGRRLADRRALTLAMNAPGELPRRARPHAGALTFLERVEPGTQEIEDLETARLVIRIQGGESDVFGELYIRYFDRLYSYLRVAFKDTDAAEDATQQVFAKVLEALPRYEHRARPFRAWLFMIARNYTIRELEKRSRNVLMEPGEMAKLREDDEADTTALEWLSDRELVFLMERLPLPQRQVLMLRYMLDLTNSQIAAVLDRGEADVRVLQHRALGFLRQRLTALGRAPTRGNRAAPVRRWRRQYGVLRARRFALRP